MNDLEREVTAAIAEQAVMEKSRSWSTDAEVFRLACALRSDQKKLLCDALNGLKSHKFLRSWNQDGNKLVIELTSDFPLSDVSPTQRETLNDLRIRRILLFKLYDVYRSKNNRYAEFSLAKLSESLGITSDDVFRHVDYMQKHDYVLEYAYMDGGQSTCYIDDEGISLCENRRELFSHYGVFKVEQRFDVEPVQPSNDEYISEVRINQLKDAKHESLDFSKLIALCEEANIACRNHCWLSLIMIQRTILNHVPPVFGFERFAEVANNYRGGRSFRTSAKRLEESLRNIANMHLHSAMRRKETLPEKLQVDFRQDLDVLLAEIISYLG